MLLSLWLSKSDSVFFRNVAFGEVKDHTLRTILVQKKISMQALRLCLHYVKRHFQENQ